MKISIVLPIFVVNGQRAAKKERKPSSEKKLRSSGKCSTEIPKEGGSFVTTNNQYRGEIKLENQPLDVSCEHVIQAASDCEQIKIDYRNVALHCGAGHFSFGWQEHGEYKHFGSQCDCWGDGCESHNSNYVYYDDTDCHYLSPAVPEYNGITYDNCLKDPQYWESDFYNYDYGSPTSCLAIKSNTFTFHFRTGPALIGYPYDGWLSSKGGHVILDWECVPKEDICLEPTTTTTAWTTTTTTSTTTPGTE